jgi:hypothetical protein
MPKYHVTIVATCERVYEIEAADAAAARRWLIENDPPEPLSEVETGSEIEDVSEVKAEQG